MTLRQRIQCMICCKLGRTYCTYHHKQVLSTYLQSQPQQETIRHGTPSPSPQIDLNRYWASNEAPTVRELNKQKEVEMERTFHTGVSQFDNSVSINTSFGRGMSQYHGGTNTKNNANVGIDQLELRQPEQSSHINKNMHNNISFAGNANKNKPNTSTHRSNLQSSFICKIIDKPQTSQQQFLKQNTLYSFRHQNQYQSQQKYRQYAGIRQANNIIQNDQVHMYPYTYRTQGYTYIVDDGRTPTIPNQNIMMKQYAQINNQHASLPSQQTPIKSNLSPINHQQNLDYRIKSQNQIKFNNFTPTIRNTINHVQISPRHQISQGTIYQKYDLVNSPQLVYPIYPLYQIVYETRPKTARLSGGHNPEEEL